MLRDLFYFPERVRAKDSSRLPHRTTRLTIVAGTKRNAKSRFKQFVRKVRQAKAQARLLVEIEVRERDPRFWLTRGPGRETEGNPGWSKEVKPHITKNQQTINLLYSPEWNSLWAHILKVLSAFPEARAALAAELQNMPALPGPKSLPPQ